MSSDRETRYMHKLTISAVFPLLLAAVSLWFLRQYSQEFPEYYSIDILLLSCGFLLLIGPFTALFILYINEARYERVGGRIRKRIRTQDVRLNPVRGIIVISPFGLGFVFLSFFISLAAAWQLSMGFFIGTGALPMLVYTCEKVLGTKILVREERANGQTINYLCFKD